MSEAEIDFKEGQCLAWDSLTYASKLEIAKFIFAKISYAPCCSFRRLIYNRLGFDGDAYEPLYRAGGIKITNAMNDAYLDEEVCN